jgi:hypothetical protein
MVCPHHRVLCAQTASNALVCLVRTLLRLCDDIVPVQIKFLEAQKKGEEALEFWHDEARAVAKADERCFAFCGTMIVCLTVICYGGFRNPDYPDADE